MKIKCPKCGKEIASDANFCPNCGCVISKIIDAEVEPIKQEKNPTIDNEQISKYEKEIESCRRARGRMIGWGIALLVVGLIGVIVFTILLCLGLVKNIDATSSNQEIVGKITAAIIVYYCAIILCALGLTGGQVLIILGAVVNTVKIKKRENRIEALRQGKRI